MKTNRGRRTFLSLCALAGAVPVTFLPCSDWPSTTHHRPWPGVPFFA